MKFYPSRKKKADSNRPVDAMLARIDPVPLPDHVPLAAFVSALPDPVIVVGPHGRVIAANAPVGQILPNLRVGDLLIRSLRDPDVMEGLRRAAATGASEIVAWRDRVPVERSFEVSITPFHMGEHEPSMVMCIRDHTEAVRIERMRADFVANASHELRTPLASLLGFVETLQGPAREDAKARERFLGIMADQARRMARLIDDLLSLSRIEQNLHLRPNSPVDLVSIVRQVADSLSPLATERMIRLEIVAPKEGVVVAGDKDELVRVAENLIENALKYGYPEEAGRQPEVTITIARQHRNGLVSVRDNGPGIAPEHLPRLTERFYRVDAGQSRAKGGTGLGLAIVKHIMARHRGRLEVDAELGHGATFTITVPAFEKPSKSSRL